MSFLMPKASVSPVQSAPPAKPTTHLRFSSSLQGRPKAIGWGRCRISPNCTWYRNFRNVTVHQANSGSSAGGKGFMGGSSDSSSQNTGSDSFLYYVDLIWSIGEGPVCSIPVMWRNKHAGPLRHRLSLMGGTQQQVVTSFVATNYPDQALAYRGEAYTIAAGFPLGSSPSLPNISYEVTWGLNPNVFDISPADVIYDFLTNSQYGVGFNAALLGDFTQVRNYWGALGLNLATTLTEQVAASSFLQDLCSAVNFEFVWSNGLLKPVAYADANENGNGFNFVVDNTPVYDLTIDDFITEDIGSDDSSIEVYRKPRADMYNRVRLEFLDRDQQYNPSTVEAVDGAAVLTYGERPSDLKQSHMFANKGAASHSATLQLHRAQLATTYKFTLGQKFILLDPMDLVTLTEPALGFDRVPCRIIEIQENDRGTLDITAEEYGGSIRAPQYQREVGSGTQTDYNVDPGSINTPYIFEPPYQFASDLVVACAVSGVDLVNWGGCVVYVSSDGNTYTRLGVINGPSRMGKAINVLPSFPAAINGPTIDTTSVWNIDFTMSGGSIVSASQNDMLAANTSILVDNEIISYQNAVLTDKNKYSLVTMLRGAFGTAITAHAANAKIVRMDAGVFTFPYTPDRIGSTVYFKFQSFNVYGGGLQDISVVGAVPYVITGSPLATTMATPKKVRTVFSAGFQELSWDEILDFRPGVRYKIYRGDTPDTALVVGDVAHPPFRLPGTGTYFVVAFCVPEIGMMVSSAASQPITIAANMIITNPLQIFDEVVTGWAGRKEGLTKQGISPNTYLALNSGSFTGTYTCPPQDVIDLGYVGVLALNASWKSIGVPVGQSILDVSDFLGQTDIFSVASSAYVDSYVEVQIGTPGPPDVYSASDVYQEIDVYDNAINWGDWQKFIPGNYPGRYANFRITITTSNPQVTGYLLAFTVQASVPSRIDHFQGLTIPSGGRTITFQPDGAATPARFNGGPNGAALPYYNITMGNQQVGDTLSVTALSLSSITIQILNGGNGVTRSGINVDVQGY